MFLRHWRIALYLLLFVLGVTFISDITCHRSRLMRLMCSRPPDVQGDRGILSRRWCYSLCGFEHSRSLLDPRKVGPLLVLLLERRQQFPAVHGDVGLDSELQKRASCISCRLIYVSSHWWHGWLPSSFPLLINSLLEIASCIAFRQAVE